MTAWYCAKASIESTARYYLERAGIEIFRPVEHHFFIDPRTKHEKFRVRSIFAGYAFFKASNQDEMNRASHVEGVSYVLGHWTDGGRFVAEQMPAGWIERLIESGPVVYGRKRAKFNTGDEVRVIIAGVSEIIGRVVRDAGKRVKVSAPGMFGQEVEIEAKPEMVEAIS